MPFEQMQTVRIPAAEMPNGEPADPRGLRLAIFSDSLPERNGAGAYYHDLAAQLRPRLGGLELFQHALKQHLLKFTPPLPGDRTQKLPTPNVFRLTRDFRRLRPHLVVAVTPGPFGLLGMLLAKQAKTGFISAFHTHFEGLVRMYGNSWFFRTAHWYLEGVNKMLCRRSATVLVNNKGLNETVRRLGAPAVDVMGTPLSLVFLAAPPPPPVALKRVLFAGRLALEKNLPAVVEAAQARQDIEFVIAGDGPLRLAMDREAAALPNMRLTGWLGRNQLCREIDAADLLLLPSHQETFGTVALEAMARGRPALVSANAGIHEWTVLKDALFVLEKDQSIASVLTELQDIPSTEWAHKAEAARAAAQALNDDTIDQWEGFVSRFGRFSG